MEQETTRTQADEAKRMILWDGVCSRLMDALTGGVILAALALHVGADRFTIGLLASLPFFAQVAQLPTVKILLHVTDRRRVVVAACVLGRILLLVIAALLLVAPDGLTPTALLALIASTSVFAVVAAGAWNWWMRDVIPRAELGRYFGRRARITTLIATAAILAAGAVLEWTERIGQPADGYALLYALGALAGLAGAVFLSRTPHPVPKPRPTRAGALRLVATVLVGREHQRLLVGLAVLGAALALALPFTAVYLLDTAGYGFLAVTILALVSQLGYVGSLRGWGYLSDTFGNRAVLVISAGLLAAGLAGWGFTWFPAGTSLFLFLIALHFVTGFALGGIELTSSNILLKNAPEDEAPAYLAAMAVTRALVAGLVVVAAGALWQALGPQPIAVRIPGTSIEWILRGFHLLAFGSVPLAAFAIVALLKVPEEGGTPVITVARAMRREVHVISSVAGIRAFVHVVSYAVEFLAERGRPHRAPEAPVNEPSGPTDQPPS